MVSPAFNVTDPKMVLKWEDCEGISGGADKLQVWVSTTGGATPASFTTKIYDAATDYLVNASGAYVYTTRGASLAAFNGQNIRIAIRNNSTNQGATLVDNVGTQIMPNAVDGSTDVVTIPKIVPGTSSNQVKVKVSNGGATTITQLQMTYTVDAGTPVSQTFTGLSIPPYGKADLTFTTPINNPAVGQHSVSVSIVQVNGAPDPFTINNSKMVSFAAATKSVPRSGLMEEFTSSTCAPCKTFNATFDPLVLTNKANEPASKFNIIKYQMNWPAPDNDVSYNSHGLARRTYYGVNSIPDHTTNGAAGGSGNQAEITASKAAPAFLDITDMTFIVKKDSLIATATITPHFTLTGTYKVHMASTEYHYVNPGNTTGQTDYYHVMRNMMGGGNGTVISGFTAGTPQTFRWAHKWTVGTVTQMSNTYWNHPIGNGNLVVFVQDDGDKSVLQSAVTKATWPVGVKELNSVISQASVYPNPAFDHTSIAFKLESASTVGVQVIDAAGRVVYNVADQMMAAGSQVVEIPTTTLAAGLYTIKVQAEAGAITQRFSVVK
jgi:hypothetical protein